MSEKDVIDPVGVGLDLLAEGRWLGLLGCLCRNFFWGYEWVIVIVGVGVPIEVEIPGAYQTISTPRVAVTLSAIALRVLGLMVPHRIERSVSIARPLTPKRCPPGEFARGSTSNEYELGSRS